MYLIWCGNKLESPILHPNWLTDSELLKYFYLFYVDLFFRCFWKYFSWNCIWSWNSWKNNKIIRSPSQLLFCEILPSNPQRTRWTEGNLLPKNISDIIQKIWWIMLRGEVCLEISECFVTFSEWRPGPGTAWQTTGRRHSASCSGVRHRVQHCSSSVSIISSDPCPRVTSVPTIWAGGGARSAQPRTITAGLGCRGYPHPPSISTIHTSVAVCVLCVIEM